MTSVSYEASVHAPHQPTKQQQQETRRDERNGEASPVSGKVSRMGLRECTAYEAQLRSLLDAAVAEPPPPGIGTAEVERRMRLIQMALEEVTTRAEQLRRAKEARERQRYVTTLHRRIATEEEAEKTRVYEDKHREELVEEMRLAQVAYFKDRNERDDDKAGRCKEYNARSQADTIQRATMNDSRRARNMENLAAERERHIQELRAKDRAQQESIRETNRRKAARLEIERREREKAAKLREQEMEAKLAAIRESKRSTWVAKQNASRAKSSVVFKNGQAILETEAKDHEKLVEDLENKIKSQQARYAEERAEQLLYLQQRAQHHALREENQQANLLRLVEGRLERGQEIVGAVQLKKERAERAKEAQASQYQEHGVELRKNIAQHRKRADEIRRQREEEALAKNYRRWNHRAARIIAELNEAVDEDEAAAQHAAAPTSNSYRGQQTPSATGSQRGVRLPSPSEFDV